MEVANIVLVLFVIIRVVIAAGLIYLIYYEVKRYRRTTRDKEREDGTKDRKRTGISSED